MTLKAHRSKNLLLVPLVLSMLAACTRTAPILDYNDLPYPGGSIDASRLGDVERAMIAAGTELGWMMQKKAPGLILASLENGSRIALAEIRCNVNGYSIVYKDSTDLRYDGLKIHRNYNAWITNLNSRLRIRLAGAGL